MIEQRRAASVWAKVAVFVLVFMGTTIALTAATTVLGISTDGVSGPGAVARAICGIISLVAAVVAVRRMGR